MPFEIRVEPCEGYLCVSARGAWVLSDIEDLIDRVASEAQQRGAARVLLDIRAGSGIPSDRDRRHAPDHAAPATGKT